MGYLGKLPATQGKDAGPTLKIDDISGDFNGSKTAFDLKIDGTGVSPHINNIQIYLSGVHQQPTTAFTLAGSSSGSPSTESNSSTSISIASAISILLGIAPSLWAKSLLTFLIDANLSLK